MAIDWDDAYQNAAYIPDGESYPPRWQAEAAAFRARLGSEHARTGLAYGWHPREKADLFLPDAKPVGLVVFVHGGYWRRFDRTDFSHLAEGALAHGWAVAMPGYPLTPEVRIFEITRSIARAVAAAAKVVAGPIRLAGHSAGGHLVVRQVCADAVLQAPVRTRIANVVSISGVHDLRPLLRTGMNEDLRLDADEARAESPVLLEPAVGARVHVWVGGDERPEFVRQSTLLANMWTGFDTQMSQTKVSKRHHFDVIEPLAHADSELVDALLAD